MTPCLEQRVVLRPNKPGLHFCLLTDFLRDPGQVTLFLHVPFSRPVLMQDILSAGLPCPVCFKGNLPEDEEGAGLVCISKARRRYKSWAAVVVPLTYDHYNNVII